MNMKKKQLTEMQQSFVVNYIKNGFNMRQAALSAGYSQSFATVHAHKLISHPVIKEKIENAYRTVEAGQNRILCMTLYDKAKALSDIIYDVLGKDGEEPKRAYYKDAIAALKELNKMQGDYAPDKRLTMTVDATKERLVEARRQYKDY